MREDLLERAKDFCAERHMSIVDQLGYGFDGSVWSTSRPSAIKVLVSESLFRNEKLVYLRLKQADLRDVAGFAIPEMLGFDDVRMIVEMKLVRPPFIVDFAGAYLDQKPPFSAEVWAEWEVERKELFESDWKWVKRAMWALEAHGIYLNDVKPGNVTCR